MWLKNWLTKRKQKYNDLCFIKQLKDRNIYLIYPFVISKRENLVISNNVYIGPNAWIILRANGKLRIDEGVIIGPRLKCLVANHNYEDNMLPYSSEYIVKDIWIEKNVWIGTDVTILPGFHIGEGAIIGACAVVTKNIPPCAIAVGNPCQVIKYRDKEKYLVCKDSGKIYMKHPNNDHSYKHIIKY